MQMTKTNVVAFYPGPRRSVIYACNTVTDAKAWLRQVGHYTDGEIWYQLGDMPALINSNYRGDTHALEPK